LRFVGDRAAFCTYFIHCSYSKHHWCERINMCHRCKLWEFFCGNSSTTSL